MYIKEMHEYYWSGSQSDPLTGFFFFFFFFVMLNLQVLIPESQYDL
jgi:hypothetical protein